MAGNGAEGILWKVKVKFVWERKNEFIYGMFLIIQINQWKESKKCLRGQKGIVDSLYNIWLDDIYKKSTERGREVEREYVWVSEIYRRKLT